MKKLNIKRFIGGAIIGVFLAIGFTVYAAPNLIYQRTILPETNNLFDLGTSSLQWRNIYTNGLTITGTCTGCGGSGVGSSTNPFLATYFAATSTSATSTFPNLSTDSFRINSGGIVYYGSNVLIDASGNINATLLLLSDTAANLSGVTPLLSQMVYETDTKCVKVGDGSTTVGNLQCMNPFIKDTTNANNIRYTTGAVIGQTLQATSSTATSTFAGDVIVSKRLTVNGTDSVPGTTTSQSLFSITPTTGSFTTPTAGTNFQLLDVNINGIKAGKNISGGGNWFSSRYLGSLDLFGQSGSSASTFAGGLNVQGSVINSSTTASVLGNLTGLKVSTSVGNASSILSVTNADAISVTGRTNTTAITARSSGINIGTNSINVIGLPESAGIYVQNQGNTNATTSYAMHILDQSGAATTTSIISEGLDDFTGFGTSTPWGFFSIGHNSMSTPDFVIGSPTITNFIVANSGNVGIGTTTPSASFSLTGKLGTNPVYISTTTPTVASSTLYAVDQAGWVHYGGGTPVLSGCGTTPLLDANSTDQAGTITFGATAAGCTLTFFSPAPSSPHCVVTPRAISLINAYTIAPTTAGIVITQAASGGTVWDYFCPLGH